MRYVECGEIRCSALGFGCGSVMGRVGRSDSLHAMHLAWDAGVTLFDTARSYGYGEAEGLLGEFLVGKRERATVVTKFGILPNKIAAWKRLSKPLVRGVLGVLPGARGAVRSAVGGEMSAGHFDVASMRASLEESLRQLRTEYVDVLLMHLPPVSVFEQDDLMAALQDVVAEGKVRRVGVSSDDFVVMDRAMKLAAPVGAVQFPWPVLSDPGGLRVRVFEDDVFSMVNHPFGGAARATAAAASLKLLSGDEAHDAGLRGRLSGDIKQRVAEVVLQTALAETAAQVVVTSMLKPEHVRANVAAIVAPQLMVADTEKLRALLTA